MVTLDVVDGTFVGTDSYSLELSVVGGVLTLAARDGGFRIFGGEETESITLDVAGGTNYITTSRAPRDDVDIRGTGAQITMLNVMGEDAMVFIGGSNQARATIWDFGEGANITLEVEGTVYVLHGYATVDTGGYGDVVHLAGGHNKVLMNPGSKFVDTGTGDDFVAGLGFGAGGSTQIAGFKKGDVLDLRQLAGASLADMRIAENNLLVSLPGPRHSGDKTFIVEGVGNFLAASGGLATDVLRGIILMPVHN